MPSTHTVDRAELLAAFDAELQPERFKDYGPNGLQVEGRARIGSIVSGVTASRALIEAAIAMGSLFSATLSVSGLMCSKRFLQATPLLFRTRRRAGNRC